MKINIKHLGDIHFKESFPKNMDIINSTMYLLSDNVREIKTNYYWRHIKIK